MAPAELDDAALIAAIPTAGVQQGPALAREAGRRLLHTAVGVLEDYCRRFSGFGNQRAVPEQIAALEALLAIGGAEASHAVARIISRGWVQGPTLDVAANVAAKRDRALPPELVAVLLRNADPVTRADACRLHTACG